MPMSYLGPLSITALQQCIRYFSFQYVLLPSKQINLKVGTSYHYFGKEWQAYLHSNE
uniref:Uncharacterized protein n=1 Tax=Rhizophora mucronata TaxID=61149 RepID=A0A2P2QYH8_RHIMU